MTRSMARIRRAAAAASPRCSSIITPDQNVPIGLAMPLPMMSKAEPWIGSNMEGNLRSGLRLAVGRDAERAGQRGGEVGQDVGVQVGGDDGVDGLRLQRHAHGHGVDQHLVPGARRGTRAATSAAISSHITMPWRWALDLVTTVKQLARARAGEREGKAHDARDAGAREHGDVGGGLLGQAAVHAAADAGILAFRVLAHDHPVELRAGDGPQRAGDARQDAGRAHVGVLVEGLADGEPQAPQRDVVGHVGRAGRAEQDGVVALDQVEAVLRHEGAGLLVALRAPVEMVEGEREAAVALGAGLQHLDARGDHLLADAVAGNGGNAIGAHLALL